MALELGVLSYNIHKGFSASNRRFVLKQFREMIHEVAADLVFLQEVLGQHDGHAKKLNEWPTVSQFEFIADKLWPHFSYGKNAVYEEGHHGNAILSRWPITFSENVDVSSRLENRGFLHAVIDLPNHKKPLHAICLHFGLFETDRKRQLDRLCDRIEFVVPKNEPLLVAGDFNDWRSVATSVLAERVGLSELFLEIKGEHARTFPCWLPIFRLDRIYYRGLTPKNAECFSDARWAELSDHAAVLGRFAV